MAKAHGAGFLRVVDESRKKIRECSVADVKRRMDAGEKLVLVDVREESEFAAGRIPGSIHIGKGVIERDIEERIPDQDTEIILYCGGGFRSALAGESVARMGYTNVVSMDGGVRGWRDAGHPLTQT
ncbi:rhodanese-like domain-containing protein [soil metagenome]